METRIPDLNWYTKFSEIKQVYPRCPFAKMDACPRFYQSLSLLGNAGSTKIESKEDKRLLEKWKKSDLWPRTDEYATSITRSGDKLQQFTNFCPEVVYDRFGLFASYLGSYADEIDMDLAHKKLAKENISSSDWRWNWASVFPVHYTECQTYSVLAHISCLSERIPGRTMV